MNTARLVLVGSLALATPPASAAARAGRLAPLPDAQSVSRHAPFEMGQCEVCHERGVPAGVPGRLVKAGNALCFDCHEEFEAAVKQHPPPGAAACVGCHSPHNAARKKLLLSP